MCSVRGFAKIVTPLSKKTGKWEPPEFELLTDLERDVFRELKKGLVSPSMWASFCPGYRYTLVTDACEFQAGCPLLQ